MGIRPEPPVRRRFRRRTVRVLVDYRVGGQVRCEYATTLGAGGMFIESEDPLPAGTPLKVRFRIPGREEVHEIEGQVAWCQPADPGEFRRAPGMGISFTDAVATSRLARELSRPDAGPETGA